MSAGATPSPVVICLRCGAAMEWRHATFQCPRCRFKIGCCEGETGDCRLEPPSVTRTRVGMPSFL